MSRRFLLRFVQRFADFHRRLHQRFGFGVDFFDVARFQNILQGFDVGFDFFLVGSGNFVAQVFDVLFGRVNQAFSFVFRVDGFAAFLVFGSMGFGVFDHFVNVGFAQTARRLNTDGLFLARGFVFRGHVDDAVRVNVERDFDLRHAARRGGNADQVELTQQFVVGGHFAFALEHADGHSRLSVFGGREHLRFARRNGRVAVNQARKHAAQRFNTQRQRGHVQQQNVFDVAFQHAALNRGTQSHDFVGVDAFVRFAAEEFFDDFLNLGHTGHAADQDDFVNVGSLQARVFQRFFARNFGAFQ